MNDMIAMATRFAGRFLMLAGLSALLAEIAARVGGGPLLLWRFRHISSLERFGLGFLLGWAAIGAMLLGLSLTGLFSAPAIVLATCALVLGSRATYARGLLLAGAASQARALGTVGLILLGLGMAPVLLFVMIPEFTVDPEQYHLGFPWQFLQAHRALLEHVPNVFQIPLPVDLTFTIPLLLGDERLAKWMIVGYFLAASAIFVARCQREGMTDAGWVGPLLFLSTGQVLGLVTTCKNDIPAAALFVVGTLLTRSGRWTLGAALLGVCVAAKITCGPLVVVWYLFHPPPRRLVFPIACFLLLPILPWWIKSYVATGNPIYPFGYDVFPTLGWNEQNQATADSYNIGFWPPDTMTISTLPGAWIRLMRAEHLLLLLVLPGMALLGRHRGAAWACVVGSILVLGVAHLSRYYLPFVWLLCLLAVQELARFPLLLRKTVMGVLAVYALLRIGMGPEIRVPVWRAAFVPLADTFQRYLTTRQEAIQALGQLKPVDGSASFKVLSVGEYRTYRFPARLVYGGVLGETPLIWQMATTSHHPAELRKKFKQLGTDFLMYNFIGAEWLIRYYPFRWDDRTLQLYVDFLQSYLTPVVRPARCDNHNGGFYFFRVLAHPLNPPAADVLFMPGAESVFARTTSLTNINRLSEALQEALAILRVVPEVAHVRNTVGHIYTKMGDYPSAYKYLKRFAEFNTMDTLNLLEFGAAAAQVGRLEVAERILQGALQRYLDESDVIRMNLARVYVQRAAREANRRQFARARDLLTQAEGMLNMIPEDARVARRDSLARIMALRGNFCAFLGEKKQAARYYREARRISPEHQQASQWSSLANILVPPIGTLE